jgi:hypothetical protein
MMNSLDEDSFGNNHYTKIFGRSGKLKEGRRNITRYSLPVFLNQIVKYKYYAEIIKQ